MRLSDAPQAYSQRDQQDLRNAIKAEDNKVLKKDRHLELVPEAYVILRSPNGTRYYLQVDNAGALSAVAV